MDDRIKQEFLKIENWQDCCRYVKKNEIEDMSKWDQEMKEHVKKISSPFFVKDVNWNCLPELFEK